MSTEGQKEVQPRRPTIKDVARLAGVGTMTVSRVVTGTGYVGAETKERVDQAIADLGYMPNHQARGLRSRRTGTIALIVADITNPYFTTLARGVEDAARPEGCLLLMGSSDENEDEELRYMNLLVQKGVDGVILVPSHAGTSALSLARKNGIPAIVADRRGPNGFDCVRCDSAKGSSLLAQELLACGHRQAGILAGRCDLSTSNDRVQGFSSAFSSHGGASRVLHGDLTAEEGRRMAAELIRSEPAPTCLFAVNNFLAIGALKAVGDLGLKVPEDISIVGFDDLPDSMVAYPFLTIAFQPAYEMGFCAGRRLLEMIAQPSLAPQKTLFETTLVRRGSVGPVKTKP